MKSFLAGLLVWALFSACIARGDSLSPYLGLNLSFASGSPPREGSPRWVPALGLEWEHALKDRFSWILDAAYIQKGVRTTVLGLDGTVQLNYLEIATGPAFRTHKGRLQARFALGPVLSFAVSRNIELLSLLQVDLSNRFAGTDFSLFAGAGVDFTATAEVTFFCEARFYYGLLDQNLDAQETYYTRLLQARAGARWSFN